MNVQYDEGVIMYGEYISTLLSRTTGDIETEANLLALYKSYCDRSCIIRMAKVLYERFPDYIRGKQNELNPIEFEIPEKRASMNIEDLKLELLLAELMEDVELQKSIKQKRNRLMGTNF